MMDRICPAGRTRRTDATTLAKRRPRPVRSRWDALKLPRMIAGWVLLTALGPGGPPRPALAEEQDPFQRPGFVIPWEQLEVGPEYSNPVRRVRLIVYDSIIRYQPRDASKPPVCDTIYTREKHEAAIKRIEFGLSHAIRKAAPTALFVYAGGFEFGELQVTATRGEFIVTVTNIGYTLDLSKFPKRRWGQIDLRLCDTFHSPLLSDEVDRAMSAANARLRHDVHRALSGEPMTAEYDSYWHRTTEP